MMAGIFGQLQTEVQPMRPVEEPSMLGALANLTSTFISTVPQRGGGGSTENERFANAWDEFRQRERLPETTSPGTASFQQLRKFGAAYPQYEDTAFSTAKTALNESVAAAESSLTISQKIQEENEKAWATSPEFQYASVSAQQFQDETAAANFVEQQRIDWLANRAANEKLRRDSERVGFNENIRTETWKLNITPAQTEANLFARGATELALAIQANPSATFSLDETGVTALLPELSGTVVNQSNVLTVMDNARVSLEAKFRRDIAGKIGSTPSNLGAAPDDFIKQVFGGFDTTRAFIEKEVSLQAIQDRMQREEFIEMQKAGVPVALMSTLSMATNADPVLRAQVIGQFGGLVGEYIQNGGADIVRNRLMESSKQDITDARAAFTELVAMASGQSRVASTYPEVTVDEKSKLVGTAVSGAIDTHNKLQETDGPTRWNTAAWRQTFETPAESIVKSAAADPAFKAKTTEFMANDIMLDLSSVRDAASGQMLDLSIENGRIVVRAGEELRGMIEQETATATLDTPIRQEADYVRDFLSSSNRAKVIQDIEYKLSVASKLGDLGQTVTTIIDAEIGVAPNIGAITIPRDVRRDAEFVKSVDQVSRNLGINRDDLLQIIGFETAGTFDPAVRSRTSSATGLIQFLDSTAKGLGTTTADLARMTRAEQMQYVEKYLQPYKGKIKNFGDLYMAVHYPAAIGKDNSFVLYSEGSEAYTANRGLDSNNDGVVTRGEAVSRAAGQSNFPGATAYTGGTMTPEGVSAAMGPVAEPARQAIQAREAQVVAQQQVEQQTAQQQSDAEAMALPAENLQRQERAAQGIVIPEDVRNLIERLGGNPDTTEVVKEMSEVFALIKEGKLRQGDIVIVDGVPQVVTRAMVEAQQ